jgi:ribbon-helix-helix CopG family protein
MRKKTSVYIEDQLLRAVKIMAAAEGLKESEVFERALAAYVGRWSVAPNWQRPEAPSEEEAMRLAREALKEVRSSSTKLSA